MTDEQYRKKMEQHHREVMERDRDRAKKKQKSDQEFYSRMSSAARGKPTAPCFAPGTLVQTASGLRAIETVKSGDEVNSLCEATGQMVRRPVDKFFAHRQGRIWEIGVSHQDRPIGATGLHRFLTNQGWRRTRQLGPGDMLRTATGWTEILSVKRTGRIEPVFNLLVHNELNFVADGVVAHSFAFLVWPRIWLHRLGIRLDTRPIGSAAPWIPRVCNFLGE